MLLSEPNVLTSSSLKKFLDSEKLATTPNISSKQSNSLSYYNSSKESQQGGNGGNVWKAIKMDLDVDDEDDLTGFTSFVHDAPEKNRHRAK